MNRKEFYIEKSQRSAQHDLFVQRKAAADTQFFWDLVEKSKLGHLRKRNSGKVLVENNLFTVEKELGVSAINEDEDDKAIPVERLGARSNEIEIMESFSWLMSKIPDFLMKNIRLMNYVKPTPIQKHSIPLGLEKVDLMCCAQTGSGKTFAFLLPMVCSIHNLLRTSSHYGSTTKEDMLLSSMSTLDVAHVVENENNGEDYTKEADLNESSSLSLKLTNRIYIDQRGVLPLGVILAPTRELAAQIHLEAKRLVFGSDLKPTCVFGGNDIRSQMYELADGCDVLIATPGRLNDLADRGVISLSLIKFLVLDEADRMLDMGFEPQIRHIIQECDMPLKSERQTFLFSATFPEEIQRLAQEFLRPDYVWVGVGRIGSTVENIKQELVLAAPNSNAKLMLLFEAIEKTDGKTLIFVQKRQTASWLCECVNNHYFNIFNAKQESQFGMSNYVPVAEELHGSRTQAQRENALRLFRNGSIRILIATDVAARGLDVPSVAHVIQFDLPISAEDFDIFVHRIGRTGRAGQSGLATAFYTTGNEAGVGNAKLAKQILKLMQETNQEIPEWFLRLEDSSWSSSQPQVRRSPAVYQQRDYFQNARGATPTQGYQCFSPPSTPNRSSAGNDYHHNDSARVGARMVQEAMNTNRNVYSQVNFGSQSSLSDSNPSRNMNFVTDSNPFNYSFQSSTNQSSQWQHQPRQRNDNSSSRNSNFNSYQHDQSGMNEGSMSKFHGDRYTNQFSNNNASGMWYNQNQYSTNMQQRPLQSSNHSGNYHGMQTSQFQSMQRPQGPYIVGSNMPNYMHNPMGSDNQMMNSNVGAPGQVYVYHPNTSGMNPVAFAPPPQMQHDYVNPLGRMNYSSQYMIPSHHNPVNQDYQNFNGQHQPVMGQNNPNP